MGKKSKSSRHEEGVDLHEKCNERETQTTTKKKKKNMQKQTEGNDTTETEATIPVHENIEVKTNKTVTMEEPLQELASDQKSTTKRTNSNTSGKVSEEDLITDKDIDAFCDDIDDEANCQYESWIKLLEAKLAGGNKMPKVVTESTKQKKNKVKNKDIRNELIEARSSDNEVMQDPVPKKKRKASVKNITIESCNQTNEDEPDDTPSLFSKKKNKKKLSIDSVICNPSGNNEQHTGKGVKKKLKKKV